MVAEGYLQTVIAEQLGVSPGYVSQVIALRGIGRVEKRTDRKCLACRETFGSAGPGNRICPICKSSDEWRGAVVMYGVPA